MNKPRQRTMGTYASCNIVLRPRPNATPAVYAEDYSCVMPPDIVVRLPAGVVGALNVPHIRYFGTMTEFTAWLHEVGAVVDCCTCIPPEDV